MRGAGFTTAEETQMTGKPYIAQPDQHQQLEWINDATLTILLDQASTDGQLMVGRFTHKAGDANPYHLHRYEDEMFILLRGRALVWCDGIQHTLEEGGCVFLPRDVPHAYRIISDDGADLLMLTTPAGLEGMFRASGRDKSEPRPEDFHITPDPAIAEQFGNVIIGPPPEPQPQD
jgi:quercetin dioxygenase-like cupin family protein